MRSLGSALLMVTLAGCRSDDPGPTGARRLTATAYNNTVRDLLGFGYGEPWPDPPGADYSIGFWDAVPTWPWVFPPETTLDGFEGMTEVQTPSAYLVESYNRAALHYALYLTYAPAFWTCDSPDTLATDAKRACAWDSLERLAARAYRRPLEDAERDRLSRYFQAQLGEYGLLTAIRLTGVAILMSPQFLYRLEDAPPPRRRDTVMPLTSWELASRLSYLLWESMPDAELFAAAAEDRLQDPEELEAQVRRMLDDPRAADALVRFHQQWLGLDALYEARPDAETFSDYVPGLTEQLSYDEVRPFVEEPWAAAMVGTREAMWQEADLLLRHVLLTNDGGRRLRDLLTSRQGYVSQITSNVDGEPTFYTASLYGAEDLQGDGGEPVRAYEFTDGKFGYTLAIWPATLPAGQRAGVMTLGAVLMGRAHPVHPAPIQRGALLLERLTCETLGTPPANAAAQLPPDDPTLEGTNRQRTEAFTADPECSACHARLNPPGFAFESFDSMGAWRDQDGGLPVDTSGSFTLSSGESYTFTGAVDLLDQLAYSRQAHDCYAQHWIRYALGREVTGEDLSVTEIQDAFMDSGGLIEELLISIVQSELFRTRRVAP